MNCAEVKELLSLYHDGELSPENLESVAAHLASCNECSSELARFRELTGMMQRMPAPVPSALGWDQFETHLAGNATVEIAQRVKRFRQPTRSSRLSFPGFRRLIAVAALLLIAVGWFTVETWFGHSGHELLAADIRQYVEEFERDPQAAQQLLLTKYDGLKVNRDEAARLVSYKPAVSAGLPRDFAVDSMYLLKMPCCDCLQTVCQRADGSKLVFFEYGEEHPNSIARRPGGMSQCRGENCCIAQVNERFAANWTKGNRRISVVGVRSEAEIEELAAWLN